MIKSVKCPICNKEVKFDEKKKLPPSFPFCSKRCKLIDLGNWLDEKYTIGEPQPEETLFPNDRDRDQK